VTSKPRPRKRNAVATREAILSSARKVFARAGYDGAGVREIAAGAGVTAMLVNRYFGGKERLFAEAIAAGPRVCPINAPFQRADDAIVVHGVQPRFPVVHPAVVPFRHRLCMDDKGREVAIADFKMQRLHDAALSLLQSQSCDLTCHLCNAG